MELEHQSLKTTGDFVLKEYENYAADILIQDGNLTAESHSAFLSTVTFISPHKTVTLEQNSFIYHLLMMNGGHIFFKGENILVHKLVTEGPLTVHVPKSCIDWKQFVSSISGCNVTVSWDID